MTRYADIPEDEVLTEWFAGAALAVLDRTDDAAVLHNSYDRWEDGDAAVAFTDLGWSDGRARGQIVIYVRQHNGAYRAASAEIDTEDALRIAKALTRWAEEA